MERCRAFSLHERGSARGRAPTETALPVTVDNGKDELLH